MSIRKTSKALLSTREAHRYLLKKRSGNDPLTRTTVGFYLTYEVIPSELRGKKRFVQRSGLDAFLKAYPDGVYSNHLTYPTPEDVEPSEWLEVSAAYAYYKSKDLNSLSLKSLRCLTNAGILRGVRDRNHPKSRTLGYTKEELDRFLEYRKGNVVSSGRLADKGSKPGLEKNEPSRWVPVSVAYEYYRERAKPCYSNSWFREKVYRGKFFKIKKGASVKHLVDLESVDKYLGRNSTKAPKISSKREFPVEKAYHLFDQEIPPSLSLLQFKELVDAGLIKSARRNGVPVLNESLIRDFFQERKVSESAPQDLPLKMAYSYYCAFSKHPASKYQFEQWLENRVLEGGYRNKRGTWFVPRQELDAFTKTTSQELTQTLSGALPHTGQEIVPVVSSDETGQISVSIKDFKTTAEMKRALSSLTKQGFEVIVKP